MEPCAVCGNRYDKSFTVQLAGKSYLFDSFECAVHLLAPVCAHCGCRILGHGMEVEGVFFCCAHCAEQKGEDGLRDRI
jgi:hypothetical protein